jgi:NUMOD4 motif-containing protein/HNH endonuclease/helix-turn-helix protein
MEQWKPIEGFESTYEVSNYGRVKRIKDSENTFAGRIRKLSPDNRGYMAVNLCQNGVVSRKAVHRLVAVAFIPQIEGKPDINHKDGNKTNNRWTNLEWCTPAENVDHMCRTGLRKNYAKADNHYKAKFSAEVIREIRQLRAEGWKQQDLADRFQTTQPQISSILSGRSWASVN